MKKIFFALLASSVLTVIAIPARSQNKPVAADSSIRFKVFGACIQCKERIEGAAKGKGVKKAVWNTESKELLLIYNPAVISPEKIKKRIVAVGHDIENQKADDAVYRALPACCHYREIDSAGNKLPIDTLVSSPVEIPKIKTDSIALVIPADIQKTGPMINGIVLETGRKGIFTPLKGASIYWLDTNYGTSSDSGGLFSIKQAGDRNKLVISFTGYTADTIQIKDNRELKIILAAGKKLTEVLVNSRQRSTYLSTISPVRTQVITERELFKAACCNLSESFETNPSVDVSYNDAVTGSKQIQLLGLSGNYTQLTIENLPGPRGIATPLGLNSVAGPWVESIQLTKGIGPVVNGYESIAGQINIELKKPENSEQLFANLYINDFGKTDINLNLSKKINRKWSTGLLLHDDFLKNKTLDNNNDGFRDLPTGNQFGLINRWKYDDGKGVLVQLGLKFLNDSKTGGEKAFDESSDKHSGSIYGLGIDTRRFEAFAKTGYVFPQKKYKSIGLQLAFIHHTQDAFFGQVDYDAKEQNFYSNLIYQSIIGNTNHKFRTGFSFLHDQYNEHFKNINYQRTEIVPGTFFEYTFSYTEKFNLVAGLRADHNSLYGFFATPRLHIRYTPFKGNTIRLSAGRGERTANIFAENNSVFASARQVNIINAAPGKAYGLDPEIAWNKGISIDQKFRLFKRDGLISFDYFRNDFNNQVVVDLENPRMVKFYNLDGKSWSNSFQAEVNLELIKKLDLRLAWRYFDVKTTYSGKLLQRPLVAGNRAFANLAYAFNGWKLDYTINYNSKKRIPGTLENPATYQLTDYSPSYILMNAQVSKTVGKKHPADFYIGGENLGNFFQHNPILAAAQPFSTYFDASLVWGPLSGRMFYAGWRFKLK